ncbi:MAG: ATPase [Hyphomicrobiales bacterium]|nr:ATPase [Hyphomicrobiales bacterium]
MRDLLWYDPSAEAEAPDQVLSHPDPVKRAQAAQKRDLPRRFWKDVAVEQTDGGFRILLDGRSVKTPGKRELRLPTADVAEGVAEEWRAQETHLDPATMPMTRIANSVLDAVVERRDEVAADAVKYAGSDLLCYRAEGPDRLVARQTEGWDPLLDWIDETHGVRLLVAEGIVHVAQDEDGLARLRTRVDALDVWALAGLHVLTTLTGSFVLALALIERRLDRDAAWSLAHLDELWNAEVWGRDTEAEARLAHRRREYDAAARIAGI